MDADRIRRAVLLACLLAAFPALADNVKNKSSARAAPQSIKQQAAPPPTLSGDGPHIDKPKGASTGGAAGSVNTNKPITPTGTQSVGGQATGGSAAAGAALGTATTSSQPASGSTLVNPNAAKDAAGGATPDDFSRGKKLQGVVDGGAGALKDQANSKKANAPGQQSGTDLVNKAGALPSADAGKNATSRRGQQGEEKDSDIIKDKNGNVLGTRGELEKIGKEQNSGGYSAKEFGGHEGGAECRRFHGKTIEGPEGGPGQVEPRWRRVSAGSGAHEGPAGKGIGRADRRDQYKAESGFRYRRRARQEGRRQRPGEKTPAQVEAERRRQRTLPNDDKQQVERMQADQRAAGATMAGRRTNAINPGEQSAPAGGNTGQPKRGAQSGQPENAKGGRPGCPADNPTC